MQVAHVEDHLTHAIVGGEDTQSFGISNSAEFFHILSSSLYSDQPLAVVREVLCNAWDAHKDAGITDKPIQITITPDRLIVQDFGKGIPKKLIGPIYGTYGNSTKKNDGMQTGGFGLGCKAPFAYTDHFEVTSCSEGFKTIYAMSKTSSQMNGKPGITPIATFPTMDTGITVSIPLVNNGVDFRNFESIVRRIVKNGDMKALLGTEVLETIPFSQCEGNYYITNDASLVKSTDRILVRYGDVIYPVPKHADIASDYETILKCLYNLSRDSNYRIVFLAPPHSISVTPSRESLSMQEHTIATLKTLLNSYFTVDAEVQKYCKPAMLRKVDELVAEKRIDKLLDDSVASAHSGGYGFSNAESIFSLQDIANQFMSVNYPKDAKFRRNDVIYRLKKMTDASLIDRGLAMSFGKSYTGLAHKSTLNNWLVKRIVGPLANKLRNHPILEHTRLMVREHMAIHTNHKTDYIVTALNGGYSNLQPDGFLPYLRNIVVITKQLKSMSKRLKENRLFDQPEKLGDTSGFLIYHTSLKHDHIQAAKDFFAASGMRVIDLTERHFNDPEPKYYTPKSKPKKGYVLLSNLAVNTSIISLHRYKDEDALRTESPEFFIRVGLAHDDSKSKLPNFSSIASALIVSLFGSKGVAVNTTAQEAALISKGVPNMQDYLCKKVSAFIQGNLAIATQHAFDYERVELGDLSYPTKVIFGSKELRAAFKIPDMNLSKLENDYMSLYSHLRAACKEKYPYTVHPELQLVKAYLEAIPVDPIVIALKDKLQKSTYLKMLDVGGVSELLKNKDKNIVKVTLETFIEMLNA